jgi:hypothetical protein
MIKYYFLSKKYIDNIHNTNYDFTQIENLYNNIIFTYKNNCDLICDDTEIFI